MERLIVECAIRGTLIAAATWLVLRAARIRTPAVLHGAWTGVVAAMLLLPLWTTWGPDAAIPVLPQPQVGVDAASRAPETAAVIFAPLPAAGTASSPVAATVPSTGVWNRRMVALAIYGLVAAALLVRLTAGTLRARRLIRSAVLVDGRLSSAVCASPVTVGWFRPVVILPDTWRQWPHAKLDAVLAHEHEHARRHHPFVQWLALLNRALFWFHPVAWWLPVRLNSLAEETCDDAVLARGHDPRDYSQYLIEAAHAVGASRQHLAGVFMPGSSLPQRIRRLLDEGPASGVSRTRLVCALIACTVTAVFCSVATPVRASAQLGANSSKMVFRPLQPRWIPPESPLPQPVSLEWLEGDEWTFEVHSIITNDELTEYSRLRNAQERDAFIARFWASRDRTPDTPANEFRDEYTRRVRLGRDRFSGPGQAGFGFDTDRGRMYLMFGAPDTIEVAGAGPSGFESWQYSAVAGLGDLRLRFPAGDRHCGVRVVSPAPVKTVGVAHVYPLGMTVIAMPVEAAKMVGIGYELRNADGHQVDKSEIGWVDEGRPGETLAQHVPQEWFAGGFGCTHALPAGRYTLSTAVRFTSGPVQRETVMFEVE
jgi:GWxTD domain-containing protein